MQQTTGLVKWDIITYNMVNGGNVSTFKNISLKTSVMSTR